MIKKEELPYEEYMLDSLDVKVIKSALSFQLKAYKDYVEKVDSNIMDENMKKEIEENMEVIKSLLYQYCW